MENQRVLDIFPYLPRSIRELLSEIAADEWINLEEIRIRSGAPLTIGVGGESCFVTPAGGVTNYESDAYKSTSEEVQTAFATVCENSVYAHLDEICRGYITLRGGHRVGICGKVVADCGKIKSIREVSSLNFRIAHQLMGIADGIIDSVCYGGTVKNTIIISPPQVGKTTLLRDMARQISNRGFKCGIADDRGELAAMYKGVPTNDVGAQTDVIEGAPKSEAIEMLLRTMSPKVIFSDEIASENDVEALRKAAGSGVKLIVTTHGENVEDALKRPFLAPLLRDKVFDTAIVLKRDFLTPDSVVEARVVEL